MHEVMAASYQACAAALAKTGEYESAKRAASRALTAAQRAGDLLLAAASGGASYLLIRLLWGVAGMAVLPAKLLAETALFFVNFAVSRDFVFTRRKTRTDASPR